MDVTENPVDIFLFQAKTVQKSLYLEIRIQYDN